MQLTCGFILLLITHSISTTEINIDSPDQLQAHLCGNESLICNSNTTLALDSNTTHFISSGSFCLIRDITDVRIIGSNSVISCNETNIAFMNVTNLTISGILFRNCGGFITDRTLLPLVNASSPNKAVLTVIQCTRVLLSNLVFQDHQGYAIIGVNLFGTSTISSISIHQTSLTNSSGMFFYYTDTDIDTDFNDFNADIDTDFNADIDTDINADVDTDIDTNQSTWHSLLISESLIVGNKNLHPMVFESNGFPLGRAAGLSIGILQESYNVFIAVKDTVISRNSGLYAAGVQIVERNCLNQAVIEFNNCTFQSNDLLETASGAGMQILFFFEFENLYNIAGYSANTRPSITIANSIFSDHYEAENGAAISIFSQFQNLSSMTVLIANTSFVNNDAFAHGDCIIAREERSVMNQRPKLILNLDNVSISTFRQSVDALVNSGSSGAVTAIGLSALNIRDSILQNGDNSAVTALSTDVFIYGNTTFANNNAVFGGALYLQKNSHLFLGANANVNFLTNTAVDRGGAVYIDPVSGDQCAIQFVDEDHVINNNGSVNTNLLFVNNTARIGSSVYGAPLYNCFALPGSSLPLDYQFNSVYQENFHFISSSGDSSFDQEFRSFPTAVCMCNISSPAFQCVTSSSPLTIFPGKKFKIAISPIDDVGQPVESAVISRLSHGYLGSNKKSQDSEFVSDCTEVI